KTCHILYITQSEARHTDEIVRSLKGKPILTVADTDGSAGIIIRFIVENNKVHFSIDQEAAREADLTLSSKLLRVADAPLPRKER
ncbi:MAG TPA: YfiR family protein, partial [Verrucomicrobiaceae bacterium]